MTAATLTFGVTELALGKVHDVETMATPPLPQVIADWIVRALGGWVAGRLEGKARELAELSVWFQGALVQLEHERVNSHVDLNDKLVPSLEHVEEKIQDMRGHVLKLMMEFESDGHRGRVVQALRAVAHAGADLYESLVQFKWAVMEGDADVDVRHGNFEVFDDPDSLIASLRN